MEEQDQERCLIVLVKIDVTHLQTTRRGVECQNLDWSQSGTSRSFLSYRDEGFYGWINVAWIGFYIQLHFRNALKWDIWCSVLRVQKSFFLTLCIFLRFLHLSEDSFLFNFELVFQTCNKMKSKTAIKGRYETYQLPEFNFMTSNYVNNVSFSSSKSSNSSSSLLCAFHQTRCD